MKNLLILVLVAALLAALYFSKPTDHGFHYYVKTHPEVMQGFGTENLLLSELSHPNVDKVQSFCDSCKFDDHTFWINVSKDGKLIYTGIAGKWFKRTDANAAAPATPAPMAPTHSST